MKCPKCDKFVCCIMHSDFEHKNFHGEINAKKSL